jgi:predicted amidohydrolase
MKAELTFAAISMTTTDDKSRNIETALSFVKDAAKAGADWVQLPEMFPFMGSYDRVYDMAEMEGGPLYQALASAAREHRILLIAGTVGERPDQDRLPKDVLLNDKGQRRVFNTCYVFGRQGELLGKYRKTHLFNLSAEDGRPRYCESDGFIPGDKPVSLTLDGLAVGLSICYDLRFPEFYSKLATGGHPDVLAIPSAFTKATGKAHWELLLRARAVERQAYVFAANQTGTHGPGKESFGHSLIVDPWGTVLADTGDQPGVAIAKISRQMLTETRTKLPALANRRPALY